MSKNARNFMINDSVNIFEPYNTNEGYENITEICQTLEPKVAALQHLVDHINEEFATNNLQHVEAIITNLDHAFTILSNIKREKNKKSRRTTWRRSKPWTIYLNNT
ncbi:5982_t:CDS:1 [Dentiscutata heterogama]|uniref:5982_t:CDS:1 n=1 Tax=Dentiscutata heterogama TaxID=1316150 RepID=A0ACA9K8I2_9GLOM|nr:5982_t:CDS:1 [Dentiscutata heterogama]